MSASRFPHNAEAEAAVLGSCLLRGAHAFHDVADLIEPRMFWVPAHAAVFKAMRDLLQRGEPIDTVSVEMQLRAVDELKLLRGGIEFLNTLVDRSSSSRSVRHHATMIRELASVRGLLDTAKAIIEQGTSAQMGHVGEFIDRAERDILRACEERVTTHSVDASAMVRDVFEWLRRRANGEILVVHTGLVDLDRITGGLESDQLIVVAGRPGSGKTSLVLSICANTAIPRTHARPTFPALFFSLEMSSRELGQRLLAQEARLDILSLRTASLLADDMARLVAAAPAVSAARIKVDDTPALTLLEMSARARAWRRTIDAKTGLIIVDHIGLAKASRDHSTRALELGEVTAGLKVLAKETKCPVIALAQLNRKVEERAGGRPQLADLRESGSIEQDADVVLFVHREELYLSPDAAPDRLEAVRGTANLILGKQRNGPLDEVKVAFHKKWARFENLERVR